MLLVSFPDRVPIVGALIADLINARDSFCALIIATSVTNPVENKHRRGDVKEHGVGVPSWAMARRSSTLISARTGSGTTMTATSAPASLRHPSSWPCAGEAVSNVPQIQFNDDDVWHDFAPGRVALKAGPWFPHVVLWSTDVRLTDLLVRHHWPITSQR